MLKVHTNFSGASLGPYTVSSSNIVASLRQESLGHVDGFCFDYNRHFAFGVENQSSESEPVKVYINCSPDGTRPSGKALLYCSDSLDNEFAPASFVSSSDLSKSYYFEFVLEAGQAMYIANYYYRSIEKLEKLFDQLGGEGQASREVIGLTAETRELVCYGYPYLGTEKDTVPAVLITSGFHPPESDTIASEAIMEFLASEQGQSIRNRFHVFVMPISNPDGFAHGYNGCNASEINFFWKFEEENRQECCEAFFLWKFVERIQPIVYLDFHGYTFQLEKRHASPYMKPTLLYEGSLVKRIVRKMNAALLALSGGYSKQGILTFMPSMLASKITEKFNTITFAKYHLHLKDGIQQNRQLAINVLTRVLDRLVDEGITHPAAILKSPYGHVHPKSMNGVLRQLFVIWSLRIRPILGQAKRWVLQSGDAS